MHKGVFLCLCMSQRVNVRSREKGKRGRREESSEEWRLGALGQCPPRWDRVLAYVRGPDQEGAQGPDPLRAKVNIRKEAPVVTVAQAWLFRG